MRAMRRSGWSVLAVACVLTAACSAATDPVAAPTGEPIASTTPGPSSGGTAGPAPDAAQVERMKGVGNAYARYTKVVPDLHVAPALCAAPIAPKSNPLLHSSSTDPWTHGKKLYYLFAADAEAYKRDGGREGTKQPDNQVIVKESYVAEEAAYDPNEPEMVGEGAKFWRKGARASLFIMARHEGKWEFGTISPTGQIAVEGTATRACHDCHDSKPDGLFGLKKEP
ncbi:MAG: hypothetical protein U0414_02195 [Polyangiaceae bacterium]